MQGFWWLVKYHSAIVGQISQDITEFEGVNERRTLVLHKTAVDGSLTVSEWQELI
jgi:hypothetical protein